MNNDNNSQNKAHTSDAAKSDNNEITLKIQVRTNFNTIVFKTYSKL
jgi:hypothetical protein